MTSALDVSGVDFGGAGNFNCRVDVVWNQGQLKKDKLVSVALIDGKLSC